MLEHSYQVEGHPYHQKEKKEKVEEGGKRRRWQQQWLFGQVLRIVVSKGWRYEWCPPSQVWLSMSHMIFHCLSSSIVNSTHVRDSGITERNLDFTKCQQQTLGFIYNGSMLKICFKFIISASMLGPQMTSVQAFPSHSTHYYWLNKQ